MDGLANDLGLSSAQVTEIVRLKAHQFPDSEILDTVKGARIDQIEKIFEAIEAGDSNLRPKFLEFRHEWETSILGVPIAHRKHQFELLQELLNKSRDQETRIVGRIEKGSMPGSRQYRKKAVRAEDEAMLRRIYQDQLNIVMECRKATAEPLRVDHEIVNADNIKSKKQETLNAIAKLVADGVISAKDLMACIPSRPTTQPVQ